MITALLTDSVADRLAGAVDFALLWGLDALALRTIGGERVPHVNESALGARLFDSELGIALVDPGLFDASAASRVVWMNEVETFAETIAFCRRLGGRTVRTGALGGAPGARDALRALGDAAAPHGFRIAVGNNAGTDVATGAALAALLAEVAHPSVGADWRPAEAAAAGETPPDGLAALVAADVPMWSVEVRDRTDGGEALPGEGTFGWPAMLATLAGAGFDGVLALDLAAWRAEGARIGPVGLRAATALVYAIRAARKAHAGDA